TPPRRNPWPWLIGAAALIVIGGTLTITLTGSDNDGGASWGTMSAAPAAGITATDLKTASTECGAGELDDNDHTLLLDMAGQDFGTGSATPDDVACVLYELDAPRSVTARMDSTRALDGMQTATWEGYEASWTYHPDAGLDLIITQP
ncbi:MAG: hypothetical protein LC635_05200, partial [Pseudonocardiaceae bacterium]|nr:hypothetical protein [Pseudonocardiaceae bacterium]